MSERYQPTLGELQERDFERIPLNADAYVGTDHALAVYVQDALFEYGMSHRCDEKDMTERDARMSESPGGIILFPSELWELRYRAAYHGAGIATEDPDTVPRAIANRLSDNLSNYRPVMDYEQLYVPWTYKFDRDALRAILRHDFYIAACDSADGDLNRLGNEPDDELYD